MNISAQRQVLYDFMHQQPLATIATIGGQGKKPEAALIAFVQTPDLEILFETFAGTRKQRNLARNPRVALVIGWDVAIHRTMQYEGVAEPVTTADMAACRQLFVNKKTPCTDEFLCDQRVRFYRVRPVWIGYSDYTGQEPRIIELEFENP